MAINTTFPLQKQTNHSIHHLHYTLRCATTQLSSNPAGWATSRKATREVSEQLVYYGEITARKTIHCHLQQDAAIGLTSSALWVKNSHLLQWQKAGKNIFLKGKISTKNKEVGQI